MIINFIYEWVYPFSKGGGEKRIFEYAKILSQNTNNVVKIVSMDWWGKNDDEGKLHIASCRKMKLQHANGQRRVCSSIFFGVSIFFHTIKSKADIFDMEIFPYFPIIFARLAVYFKKDKPVIVGYWSEYIGKKYWKKSYGTFWWAGVILERLSFLSCEKVVANSHFTKNKLQKAFGKNKKQISVIPPVSIDIDKIDKVQAQEKIYDMIYYGRIIAHKHVEHIVDIVEKLAIDNGEIKALIIGSGPDKKKIKERIGAKNLSKNIDLIDFVDKYDDLIKYIKSSKIMIQPSEREGFGITLVEANACGLPVFVIDYPDNAAKTLIKSGVNGFVFSNIEEMITYMQVFFQSKNKDAKLYDLSVSSIKLAQKYRKDVIDKKILNYYENV